MKENSVRLKKQKGVEMVLTVQDIFGLKDSDVLRLKKSPDINSGTVMVEMISEDKGRMATIINLSDLEAAIRLIKAFD